MTDIAIPVKLMAGDLPLPRYMSEGAAGMDLLAAVNEAVTIPPGGVQIIPTGLMAAVPAGYELQVRPRSGLAINQGIGVLNSPGTIDSDYRGEIKVILINLGSAAFKINRGERIAQIVLSPVLRINWRTVEELPPTARGAGGFGHTGKDQRGGTDCG